MTYILINEASSAGPFPSGPLPPRPPILKDIQQLKEKDHSLASFMSEQRSRFPCGPGGPMASHGLGKC